MSVFKKSAGVNLRNGKTNGKLDRVAKDWLYQWHEEDKSTIDWGASKYSLTMKFLHLTNREKRRWHYHTW